MHSKAVVVPGVPYGKFAREREIALVKFFSANLHGKVCARC